MLFVEKIFALFFSPWFDLPFAICGLFVPTKNQQYAPLLLRFAMRLPFDAYAVFGAEGWREGMRRANLHQESLTALIRELKDTGLVIATDPAWAASTLWAVFVANFLNFVRMSGGEKGDKDHGSRPADIDQIRSLFAFCFRGLGTPEPEWATVIERLITENAKEEK